MKKILFQVLAISFLFSCFASADDATNSIPHAGNWCKGMVIQRTATDSKEIRMKLTFPELSISGNHQREHFYCNLSVHFPVPKGHFLSISNFSGSKNVSLNGKHLRRESKRSVFHNGRMILGEVMNFRIMEALDLNLNRSDSLSSFNFLCNQGPLVRIEVSETLFGVGSMIMSPHERNIPEMDLTMKMLPCN